MTTEAKTDIKIVVIEVLPTGTTTTEVAPIKKVKLDEKPSVVAARIRAAQLPRK